MLIFVEGADGSGKSTLIQQLSENYVIARVPKDAESYRVWNEFKAMHGEMQVVFDRSPLTEIIYRSVFGGKTKFTIEDCLAWLKGNKLIICDTDTAYRDAQNRGEDNVTDESAHILLRDRYSCLGEIFKQSGFDVCFYDWRYQSVDDIIEFIEGGK